MNKKPLRWFLCKKYVRPYFQKYYSELFKFRNKGHIFKKMKSNKKNQC